MAKIDHGAPVEGRFDDNNKGYEQAPPAMSSLGYIFQLLTDGFFFPKLLALIFPSGRFPYRYC